MCFCRNVNWIGLIVDFMNYDSYFDVYIKIIFDGVKIIVMVGVSVNVVCLFYFVLKYMLLKGYDVWLINLG